MYLSVSVTMVSSELWTTNLSRHLSSVPEIDNVLLLNEPKKQRVVDVCFFSCCEWLKQSGQFSMTLLRNSSYKHLINVLWLLIQRKQQNFPFRTMSNFRRPRYLRPRTYFFFNFTIYFNLVMRTPHYYDQFSSDRALIMDLYCTLSKLYKRKCSQSLWKSTMF